MTRWLASVLAATLVLAGLVRAVEPQTAGSTRNLHAAFTPDMFTDVRVSDALAAIRLWAAELSRRGGFGDDVSVDLLSTGDEIVDAIASRRIDLVVLRSTIFLEIRSRLAAAPVSVTDFDGHLEVPAVLLVHKSSGLETLEALRGRDLLVVDNTLNAPGQLWLESAVLKRNHASLEAFFSHVRHVTKTSQAVLPVFFRQSSATLVDRPSFETMVELNPQLARDLKVLDTSPPLLPGVLVLRNDYDAQRRPALLQALVGMSETPRGQQLLTLFRSRALVPYRPELLENIERLANEHRRLKAAALRQAAPSGGLKP